MNFIKEYQSYRRLVPDGIIGKHTLSSLMEDLNINSISDLSHLLGQSHHESSGFSIGRENLNYSAAALELLFSKYFPNKDFSKYARNPVAIANKIYANRLGNGSEESWDGYKYRGVGPIQLTGKSNIQAYFKANNIEISTTPDIILHPEHYFNSAKFYFDTNDVWKYTKNVTDESILKVSRFVNLGNPNSSNKPLGLKDRQVQTYKYYKLLMHSFR